MYIKVVKKEGIINIIIIIIVCMELEREMFLLALQPDVDDSHDDDWQHGSH